LDVFAFDMDGVIFQGDNFWLELHAALGTRDQALDLAARYLHSDYARLGQITAGTLWRGESAKPFTELVQARRYVDGVQQLLRFLRRENVITCIISSGPCQLAERAQAECGIHSVFANRLDIEDGVFTGTVEIAVNNTAKGAVLRNFLDRLGRRDAIVAAMGDTASDADMCKHADLGIAYNSSAATLLAQADISLREGELQSFSTALMTYYSSISSAR
jgi:phosphoserine phosphatase